MSAINRTYQAATNTAGTGLFAATDVEAGEVVLRLGPEETYSVLGDTSRACDNCFLLREAPEDEGEVKLKKCAGCDSVSYCGKVSTAFGRWFNCPADCWKTLSSLTITL
jgi:hypothetical protein